MYCPKCGTKCEDTFSFCYKCGFKLPVIEETEPVAPAEEPVIAEEAAEITVETPAEELTMEAPIEEPPVGASVEATPVEASVEDVPVQEVKPAVVEAPAVPAPKKGRLWVPALVLGIMMTLGLMFYFLLPSPAQSTPPQGDHSEYFTVINGELFFDADLYTGGSELVIPETVNGQTVTKISKDCFNGCTGLSSIVLPDTLKEIDDRAFSFCSDLRGIFIPEGVTRIGNSAFSGCSSLEAIHLPGSVEIIADRALYRCPKLVHIFYDGKHANWKKLYNGSMPINTWVYCEDGNFPYTRD